MKIKRALPEGSPYEVRLKKRDGEWYASVNYWKPPVAAEDKTHVFGAVDVGQTVVEKVVNSNNLPEPFPNE